MSPVYRILQLRVKFLPLTQIRTFFIASKSSKLSILSSHIIKRSNSVKLFLTSKDTESNLRKKDQLPSKYELIYLHPNRKRWIFIIAASELTALLVPLYGLFIYLERNGYYDFSPRDIIQRIHYSSIFLPEKLAYLLVGFSFLTSIIGKKFFSMYPFRIYYDGLLSYKVVVVHPLLPWRTRVYGFTEVKESRYWLSLGKYKAKLDPDRFRSPIDYLRLRTAGREE